MITNVTMMIKYMTRVVVIFSNIQRTDDNVENSDNASGKRKSDQLDTEVVKKTQVVL
jgi:hypothetical protein